MDVISPADEHRSWESGVDVKSEEKGMKDANPENWRQWVVKLQFQKDNNTSWGTGFFINLDTTECSVIPTASHNLISDSGQPVKDLKILQEPGPSVSILPEQIRICDNYKLKPGPNNRASDYGAILLDYEGSQGGFGLSISQGLRERITTEVYLTGHHSNTKTGYPRTRSGLVKRVMPGYFRYKVDAITGNSGGPVWIAYGGYETAIAIQYVFPLCPINVYQLSSISDATTVRTPSRAPLRLAKALG
ncbi:hypothetical protein N7486_000713 [Penicillium sp. IBT 16267x]|nr:hypothetical protein N7486_000713 [Penicillium sp. IBT 16267x]